MSVHPLLTDIRVLDLAGESGVFAARLLADLGADVIRIEPPGGDAVRVRSPFFEDKPGPERSLYHLHFNRNKRGIVLDLETADGRLAFAALAHTADVVLETGAPGAYEVLGIGATILRAANPGLVYATVTPFGQLGPFRDYRGNDLTAIAASGVMYLNGFTEDPPNQPGAEQAYKMGSLAAATGILLALVGRQLDPEGRGRRIDVSMQEAASMATTQTANANIYTWHKRIPGRAGNGSGVQRCQDGKWVSFTLRSGIQETWADMADWLRDEQIDTPVIGEEWQDQAFRIQHRGAVGEAIAKLCAKHERSYIFHEGQRRKQLVLPINDVADLLREEQLEHRAYFQTIPHPELGRDLIDSSVPYRFSSVQTRPSRRAPLLGEHTEAVLAESARSPSLSSRGTYAAGQGDFRGDSARPTRAAAPTPSPSPVKGRGAGGEAAPFDPTRPLAGIRVADFSWMIAGPASSRILADFGAEVVKIESQYRLDNIRVVGVQPPSGGNIDTNGVFNDYNTNKVSLRLNVNNPRGLELTKEVIRRSDIVLNNYTAERMPRWGLGYEDLKKLRPDIIMLSMPVMGTTGPLRNYGAYGNGVIAFGGLNQSMGFPNRPPVGMGPLYSDFSGPYFVVIALMAALYHRNRTGEGAFIDFSQVEATTALLGPAVLEYTANARVPSRKGNRSDDYSPHGAFPCAGADRWVAIACASDEDWRRLCETMGKPDLAADGRFANHAARKANEDALEAEVGSWTRELDAWQAMHRLQARGVMAAVVEDLEDMVVRDPWLSTQHLTRLRQDENGVEFRTHNQPIRMDGQLPPLRRAPLFGEHSQQLLSELLELPESEIEKLLIEEVVY